MLTQRPGKPPLKCASIPSNAGATFGKTVTRWALRRSRDRIMPDDAATLPISSCRFMDALIELLGAFPVGRNKSRAEVLSERLDRLDDEARQHGASSTTLAAIQGAQILLSLAEMPPSQPPPEQMIGKNLSRPGRLRVVAARSPSSWSDAQR